MITSRAALGLFTSLFLASCAANNPVPSGNDGTSKEETQVPQNIAKVLNRVTCENMICTQENINKMWQICLSQGWSENPNVNNVKTSRDLRELISGPATYEEMVYENIEQTDVNGIVTNAPSQRTVTKEATYTGYCIGTEYIVS